MPVAIARSSPALSPFARRAATKIITPLSEPASPSRTHTSSTDRPNAYAPQIAAPNRFVPSTWNSSRLVCPASVRKFVPAPRAPALLVAPLGLAALGLGRRGHLWRSRQQSVRQHLLPTFARRNCRIFTTDVV